MIKVTPHNKTIAFLSYFATFLFIFMNLIPVQAKEEGAGVALFKSGQSDQKALKWERSLTKFKEIISRYPQTNTAQKAYIEIGKYYKYNRDWDKAITEYHNSVAISPHSREAHDAKTAEAAVYYFRQDFPRALKIFREVLQETKDWDQIKFCSYWAKELRRKMSFKEEESFSCGPEALNIIFNLLGVGSDKENSGLLFKRKSNQVSLLELKKTAAENGLRPKVVKICKNEILNLDIPFIALVDPEHYVVVTDNQNNKIIFIDPAHKNDYQTESLDEFSKNFKGYCLIFLRETQLAKLEYPVPSEEELSEIKGGVCFCCPPSALGAPVNNSNVVFDGNQPTCPGMPSWMVNTVNANFIVQDIDFSYTSWGMPIEFMRTYNGDDPRDGIFGRSWTFNYNISLVENPDQSIDVRRGDGKVDHFIWNGTRYQGPNGVYDILTKNSDGTYILKDRKNKNLQTFDTEGRLAYINDKNNNTISFTYDIEGRLIRIIDPNNKNINFSYAANNKVSRLTLADGRYVQFFYDSSNNLVQSIDMKGAATNYIYDSASYITAITTPHQGTTRITYVVSEEGYYISSITDTLGNRREYSPYDSHSQMMIVDSRGYRQVYTNSNEGYTLSAVIGGSKIVFEYDEFGNRTTVKDAYNNTTLLTYNSAGDITSITDALGNKTILTYDENDNLIQATDAENNVYNFTYDAKSNLIQSCAPGNKSINFTYNNEGQIIHITDAGNGVNEFIYDDSGNLVEMITPGDKHSFYGYDTLGRLTSLVDPKDNSFSYVYDGVDHLVKITYPDRSTVDYVYNCCNLIEVQDSKNGVLKFTYDALGRMKSFTNYNNESISYEYDGEDNITALIYPDNKSVNYEYDVGNRLSKVTDWLGNTTEYAYDSRGSLSFAVSPGLISIYKYDAAGRLAKLINYNSNTNEITSGFEFSLDSLGNRTKIKKYLPVNTPVFTLTSSNYSYNKENQVLSATGLTFEYDNNGNMTRRISQTGIAEFIYNFDNRLIQYVSGSTNLSYLYDALGNRIKKTEGVNVREYIIDPNRSLTNVLAETDNSGNIQAYYVYGLGLISKIENNNAYFYQYDGLGSTVAVTDEDGNLRNKYAYDDFGNLVANCSETIDNPFKYVGRFGVMTDTNDLLYMRARYYMPSIGRFINKDPIGLVGGMNLYGYVGGNPIRLIDPSGLGPICRLEDKDVWMQDDSIEPVPILEDPIFLLLTGIMGSGPRGWLFGRGHGLLNSNDFIRIGWGWKGTAKAGKEIFRIAIGSKRLPFHWHFP